MRWRAACRWWLTQRCRKRAEPGGWQSAGPAGRTVFGLHRAFLLATGLAPAAGLTFLCFAKEKISKRKSSQKPWPYGLPCATRAARGRAQTRYAQTSARPNPVAAALLSTAYGLGSPHVLVRCAHLAHPCWRATRAIAAAPTTATKTAAVPTAAATPSPNPLTTTATFPNLGKQTRIAAPRFKKHLSKTKKTNWLFKLPFTPAGVKGRGGSGGQNSGGQASSANSICISIQ